MREGLPDVPMGYHEKDPAKVHANTSGCHTADCAPRTWEDALECVAQHSGQTASDIAAEVANRTGKSAAYLRCALSKYDSDHNLQAQLVPVLTAVTGNPALLRWMAEQSGFGIYRQPACGEDRDLTYRALGEVMEAVGQVARAVRDANGDGGTSTREALLVTRLAREAMNELVELIAAVNLQAQPPNAARTA